MLKNIFFDLDGTVIDSSECIYTVYSALFREMNIDMPEGKDRRRLIGPPVETTLRDYIDEDPRPYGIRFRELYSKVDLRSTNRLYDGITDLLARLREEGYRLFITTSKAEHFAKKILSYLDGERYFEAIYGSRYDLDRLTKKDVLEAVIADYSLEKSECILIGDTVFDEEGGRAVGLKVGIVTYGFGDEEDFFGRNIEFFADTPREVGERIGGKKWAE